MTAITDTYFDSTAREYDERTLRGLPRYQEMLAQIVTALPSSAADILELGCGTGALTGIVAERYPAARVTAIDASASMIEVAKERLASTGVLPSDRIEFEMALFEQLAVAPAAYDLVTANMSLHHIADKQPFYASLRAALRTDGAFVFGDELRGATDDVEQRHFDAWLEFARQPGHLERPEIDGIVRHMERFDHYETLPRQLELLSAAGFTQVDCTWRYLNYGVFVALP